MELQQAYRIETRLVKEPDFPYNGVRFENPGDVTKFTKILDDMDIEKFVVLFLNTYKELVCLKSYEGTINQVPVIPRELAKISLLTGTAGVVLVHNHPSGSLTPSKEDEKVTSDIKSALKIFDITLVDHIIVGQNGTFSFIENHLL